MQFSIEVLTPLMLVVHLAFMVLLKLVLLGEILEAAFRHGSFAPRGGDRLERAGRGE